MTHVLVTGANGFVGSALIPCLIERGHMVRGAVRHRRTPLPADAETVEVGDIGPDTDWRAALSGIDTVIHLAARVHVMKDRSADPLAEFRLVNVEGSARLAEAAAAAGCRRLVFVSSVKALGEETRDAPMTDGTIPSPSTPYGLSKLEAESHLEAIAGRTGMEVVTLRPPLVYGPGVGGNFLTLLRICYAGIPLPLAAVSNRRSLLYVGNLADALERCMTAPGLSGRRFVLHDGTALATADLIRRISATFDRSPRLFALPPSWLAAAAALLGYSDTYHRLADSLVIDDTAFCAASRWQPPWSVDDGLRRVAEWFKAYHTRS